MDLHAFALVRIICLIKVQLSRTNSSFALMLLLALLPFQLCLVCVHVLISLVEPVTSCACTKFGPNDDRPDIWATASCKQKDSFDWPALTTTFCNVLKKHFCSSCRSFKVWCNVITCYAIKELESLTKPRGKTLKWLKVFAIIYLCKSWLQLLSNVML